MNRQRGLEHLITVIDGSFEEVPAAAGSFDLVWSQDALLHSGQRARVIGEAARVLRAGGELIFTDPMQADDSPEGVLQAVLERIHLTSLGSIGFYRETATALGLREVSIEPMIEHLINHYSRVREELSTSREELDGKVTDAYIDRMLSGLDHWVEAGRNGYLDWGILHFRKPAG